MTLQTNRSSHVLITLGVLFTVCGAARFLPEGQAAAEEAKPSTETLHKETEAAAPEAHAAETHVEPIEAGHDYTASTVTEVPTGEICFNGDMANALSEDRWLFEERDQSLKDQQLALQEWDSRLQARANELEALEAVLNDRWEQMQTVSDTDLKHLAQMYGSMKPDQASLIFDKMDANFAAGFLRQLPSDHAGLILANMDTEKAYVVSVRLASMNDDIRQAMGEAN